MRQRQRHLLVDISAHGYGHASMTAPVLNELAVRAPELRITLRTAVPYDFLRKRLACEFHYIPAAFDFGMRMVNAVDVQVEQSAMDYRAFHADWNERVAHEAEVMRALRPDLLLANVPYLTLAAAQKARVPAVGMCCLNWADLYQHYLEREAMSEIIHAQMLEAYNSAAMFLRAQPAMPMPSLGNARDISPIAQIGHERRRKIAARLPQGAGEKLVMVAMGGMEFRLPVEHWPHMPGVRWLIPREWNVARSDVTAFELLELPFSDLLASCDAVLTKPGYGTFIEAACAGVPVVYVSRGDWPEEPYLVRWLQRNGVCLEVERERLWAGKLQKVLARLWTLPRPPCPQANGAGEAALILQENYF
jgi:hypothetical protein